LRERGRRREGGREEQIATERNREGGKE